MSSKFFALPTLVVLLAFATPVVSKAQDADKAPTLLTQAAENGPYSYERIIEIPGASQQILFDRLKQWFIVNVKAASNEIYYDDKDHNTISVTTALRLPDIKYGMTGQYVDFKLVVAFKETKFRITGEGFVYHGMDALNGYVVSKQFETLPPIKKWIIKKIYESFDDALAAMVKGMREAAKGISKKADW